MASTTVVALVLPVIFGLSGWRAVAIACATAHIASWSGFWNSGCRLIRCTTMGAINRFTLAIAPSIGGVFGHLLMEFLRGKVLKIGWRQWNG